MNHIDNDMKHLITNDKINDRLSQNGTTKYKVTPITKVIIIGLIMPLIIWVNGYLRILNNIMYTIIELSNWAIEKHTATALIVCQPKIAMRKADTIKNAVIHPPIKRNFVALAD